MLLALGAALLATLFQLAAAHPTTDLDINISTNASTMHNISLATDSPAYFSSWASFCNDDACSEGCGTWVNIKDNGCLGESYRRSVKFKSELGPGVWGGLVYSPADSCNCQTQCQSFYYPNGGNGCLVLNSSISYETFSYRFINQGLVFSCDGSVNNC